MDQAFALLLFGGIIITFIFSIIGIVFYVLSSLGLYSLAKNAGIENPWLAWIPIGNLYILALLVKNVSIGSFEVPRLEITLPVGCVAVWILSNIPFIGWIFSIAYLVLTIMVMYKLYSIYRPQQAMLWTILGVIFVGIALPAIFIFIMRNDKPALA